MPVDYCLEQSSSKYNLSHDTISTPNRSWYSCSRWLELIDTASQRTSIREYIGSRPW